MDYYDDGGWWFASPVSMLLIAGMVLVVGGAFLFGLYGYDQADQFNQWCQTGEGPVITLHTDVAGDTLSYSVSPRSATLSLNGKSVVSPQGSYRLSDGNHEIVAVAHIVRHMPESAQYAGWEAKSCSQTTVTKRSVVVDTTAPVLYSITAYPQYDGTILITGQFMPDLSGVAYVQLEGHEPHYLQRGDDQFDLWVPVNGLPGETIGFSSADRFGNTLSGKITLPLPPNRWEKRNVWGETVEVQLSQPPTPALGWGLDKWVYVANDTDTPNVLSTDPLWYAAGILVPLAAALLAVLALQSIVSQANKKRRAIIAEEAKKAFRRCERRGWANLFPNELSPATLRGKSVRDFFPAQEEILAHYHDAVLCQSFWPTHPKVQQWVLIGKYMRDNHQTFEKIIGLAFRERELARAWAGINRLPQNVPQVRLLWLAIEEAWYPKCQELLTQSGGNLFLFDAVGIRPDPDLLYQVLYFSQAGAYNVPTSFVEMRLKLFHQLLATVRTVQEWGPAWAEIVVPQIEGVTGLGMEGFNAYLVTLALARPNLVSQRSVSR